MTSAMQATFWLGDVEVEGGHHLVDGLLEEVGEGPRQGLGTLVTNDDEGVLVAVLVDFGSEFPDQVGVDGPAQATGELTGRW